MSVRFRNLAQLVLRVVVAGAVLTGGAVSTGHASQCSNIWAWVQPPFDTKHIAPEGQQLEGTTGAALCDTSRMMSGARSSHYAYPFKYRAAAATEQFEGLTNLMELCVGPQTPGKKGKSRVNHPDSYNQRVFQAENGRVSLSLKDKGSLNQTFVFLRFDVAP